MARIKKPLGIRGKIGNLVYKRYHYGTVVSAYPDMSSAGCSPRQKVQRNKFQKAVGRAKQILDDPDLKSYYQNLPGNGSAFNKAVALFMKETDD